jgi:hypothetical protein
MKQYICSAWVTHSQDTRLGVRVLSRRGGRVHLIYGRPSGGGTKAAGPAAKGQAMAPEGLPI